MVSAQVIVQRQHMFQQARTHLYAYLVIVHAILVQTNQPALVASPTIYSTEQFASQAAALDISKQPR